jgi:hypothetical protein
LKNYGGAYAGGGWAFINGELRQCVTGVCLPMTMIAGGTLATRSPVTSRYYGRWTPGENPVANPTAPDGITDSTDARTAADLINDCWVYKKAVANQFVWLTNSGISQCQSLPEVTLLSYKSGGAATVDIGITQFDDGLTSPDPHFFDRFPAINDINDNGDILGRKDGYPVIKHSDTYEQIGEARGAGLLFNKRGDVLFRESEGGKYRMRLAGEYFDFADDHTCEVTNQTPAEMPSLEPLSLMQRAPVYMSETGQILFQGEAGLYLATPKRELTYVGEPLALAPVAGTNTAREPLHVLSATGNLSPSQVAVSSAVTDKSGACPTASIRSRRPAAQRL